MADWSNLPQDAVRSIAKRICDPEDFVRFGTVCKPWSLAMTKEHFTHHQLPWVMIYHRHYYSNHKLSDPFRFYNVAKDKIYKIDLPEAVKVGKRFFFSSMGWLMIITKGMEVNLVYLLRPTAEFIKLGNIKIPPTHGIQKFVLSSSPCCTSNYRIMALTNYGTILAFCGKEWTLIDEGPNVYKDIAYYRGQFYGVKKNGLVVVFNIEEPKHIKTNNITSSMPEKLLCFGFMYLVKSGKDLLVAVRSFSSKNFVRIYKVSLNNHNWLDSEVKDLGNKTLYLPYTQSSLLVNASDCNSCQANCIYPGILFKFNLKFNMIDGKNEYFENKKITQWSKSPGTIFQSLPMEKGPTVGTIRAAEKQGGRSSPKKTKLGQMKTSPMKRGGVRNSAANENMLQGRIQNLEEERDRMKAELANQRERMQSLEKVIMDLAAASGDQLSKVHTVEAPPRR